MKRSPRTDRGHPVQTGAFGTRPTRRGEA